MEPHLLPTDISDFTGRQEQIEAIDRGLKGRMAVPVVALNGAPGVGKTTLAIHAAHRLAARYPDGQLYADLHGRTVGAYQVLERFLRALGVPGPAVPADLDERAERYRDLLAGRRVLIVLDNAAHEDQIRPLLPGTPEAGVLVTSRLRLAALPGATHVDLRVFEPDQSAALLARIAGGDRVRAEETTAAELADLCGQLPLAIRIAGARLAARPHWSIRRLTDRLTDEARRLDELAHSGQGVRAGISLAYEQLGEDARRLFRLLTLPDFPDFAPWTAAALLDADLYDAQDLLDELADAQLLQVSGSRFTYHDLVRVFARERLAAEETDPAAALTRALGALLHLSLWAVDNSGVTTLLPPADPPTHVIRGATADRIVGGTPMSWFEAERANFGAAVRQAAGAGLTRHCWMLADQATMLYSLRGYHSDWQDSTAVAMEAVVRAGDEAGRARMLYSDGRRHTSEDRFDEGGRDLAAAADLFAALGEATNSAQTDLFLSRIAMAAGRFAAAEERLHRALATFRQEDAAADIASTLVLLSRIRLAEGDVTGAQAILPEALDLARRAGARRVEAQVLARLGETYQQEGRWDDAIEVLRRAFEITGAVGDPTGQAFTLHGIGGACVRAGRLDEAAQALDEAAAFAETAGQRMLGARIRVTLGELAIARDDRALARELLTGAIATFREMGASLFESQASILLESLHSNSV